MADNNLDQPNQNPSEVNPTNPGSGQTIPVGQAVTPINQPGGPSPPETASQSPFSATTAGISDEPLSGSTPFRNYRRIGIVVGLSVLVLGGLVLAALAYNGKSGGPLDFLKGQDSGFSDTKIPLADLAPGGNVTLEAGSQLTINGQLRLNNTFILAPGTQPNQPIKGQFYFNQTNNKVYYFNGSAFVDLTTGTELSQVAAAANAATGVTSLQGQSGALSLTGGNGIGINGLTINNTGVTSLTGTSGQLNVSQSSGGVTLSLPQTLVGVNTLTPTGNMTIGSTSQGLALQGSTTTISATNAGNTAQLTFVAPTSNVTYRLQTAAAGTYDICTTSGNCGGGGGGNVFTGGGTSGQIAKFTGTTSIGDSLISESGTTITVSGDLAVTGTINSATISGGTLSGGTFSGGTVSGGTLSASAVNGLSVAGGVITNPTIAGTVTGSGSPTITGFGTINGATLSGGTLSGGTVSGGTLSAAAVNGLGLTSSAITPTGALTIGDTGQTLTLQGGAATTLTATSGGVTNALVFATPSGGNKTITIPNETGTICTTAGSAACTAVYAPTSGGTGYVQLQGSTPGSAQTGNFNITGTGIAGVLQATTVNATTSLNTGAGSGTQRIDASGNLVNIGTITSGLINGQTISSAANFTGTLAVASTINSQTISSAANFTGTLAVQGASALTLGTASTNTGAILFKGSGSANTLTLAGPTSPSTNTLTLPNETGTLCSTGSVCTGYAPSTGGTGYIQLQGSTPGTQQTGNFNISGTGLLSVLDSTGTNGTLGIGTGSSTGALSIGALTRTLNVEATNTNFATVGNTDRSIDLLYPAGLATPSNTVRIGSQYGTSRLVLNGGSNGITLTAGNSGDIDLIANGVVNIQADGGGGLTNGISIGTSGDPGPIMIGNQSRSFILDAHPLYNIVGAGIQIGNSANNHNIEIGAGNGGIQNVTVGSGSSSSKLTLQGGTAGVVLGSSGVANTLQIGNTTGAVAQTINLGNNSTASSTNNVNIGSTVAGTTSIQGASGINIGSGGNANTIQIGNTTTTSIQTVNVGTNTTSGSRNLVTVGSLQELSSTTIQGTFVFLNTNPGGVVNIGSGTTDTSQIFLQVDSFSTFSDSTTCSATVKQGSIYYNTNSNTVRSCVDGAWEDLVSTEGLSIILFGVVPDSGNATTAGDLSGSVVSSGAKGPCKVAWASSTSVQVKQCTAYTGGRKVIVSANTTISGLNGASKWYHICMDGTDNQPNTAPASQTSQTAGLPTFDKNNPVLCLADVQTGAGSTITNIYDTRVFTTSTKTYTTVNTNAAAPGFIVKQTSTEGVVTPTTTAGDTAVRGVIVASDGTTSTTAINAIMVSAGPVFIRSTGTSNTAGFVVPTTTTGYGGTGTPTGSYNGLGVAQVTIDTTCTSVTDCQFSQFVDLNIK